MLKKTYLWTANGKEECFFELQKNSLICVSLGLKNDNFHNIVEFGGFETNL